jgi:hypothetical protein
MAGGFLTVMKGLFGSKKGDGIGGLATDIREAIKGKEIDPNKLIDTYIEIEKLKASVIEAEMSGNWLQRSWRPILMMSLVVIVVNNYILFPYFPDTLMMLDLPDELWNLLTIGVGGYVAGRSIEKAVKIYKK